MAVFKNGIFLAGKMGFDAHVSKTKIGDGKQTWQEGIQ